ncbi:MAG: hypothetical protein ABI462_06710 [Ignavibacteria bacterium]
MKNLLPLIIFISLIYLAYTSGFTQKSDIKLLDNSYSVKEDVSQENSSGIKISTRLAGVADINAEYAIGKIPIRIAMPDTLIIQITNNLPGTHSINVLIEIFDRETMIRDYDTTYHLEVSTPDFFIYHKLKKYFSVKKDLIIVHALPGEAFEDKYSESILIDTVYDSTAYCQDITTDTYNYADPCLADNGGFGFNGRKGNIVAGFRNRDTSPVILSSVVLTFFDSVGGGNKSYNAVVYGDNGMGKPGSILYISSALTSPPGTGSAVNVIHNIPTLINIAGGNKFYAGYRQTSNNSVKAAYQTEDPVRSKSFFFSSPDTGNTFFDFSDSAKNFRLDLSAIVKKGLINLTSFPEGYLGLRDTMMVYLRNTVSPYALVDSAKVYFDSVGSSKYYFSNVANGVSYYLQLKHRNTIETWSSTGKSFANDILTYNFTSSAAQAYGSNLKLVSGKYCMYAGDVDQNGNVNLSDLLAISNASASFSVGYIVTDLNGDHVANLADVLMCFNNATSFVSKIVPP